MKRYLPWQVNQVALLPASTRDWLPEGHLATFILDIVRELDIRPIESLIQARDGRGQRPYDPRMMVALVCYAYATGVHSSRRIATACRESVPFRVISGEQFPHFTVVAAFRRTHVESFAPLFKEVLKLCVASGLVSGSDLHLDGTRIQADANRHRSMTVAEMAKAEEAIAQRVQDLLRQAEEADRREDAELGVDGDGERKLRKEIQELNRRKEWIRANLKSTRNEARSGRSEELRERADNKTAAARETRDPVKARERRESAAADRAAARRLSKTAVPEPLATAMPEDQAGFNAAGEPDPDTSRNTTDSDARIMKMAKNNFDIAYNGQAVVDEKGHIIVAEGLSNSAGDAHQLQPMLARAAENLGRLPETLTADTGYYSDANARSEATSKVRLHIGVGRVTSRVLKERRLTTAARKQMAAHQATVKAMKDRLESEEGRARMRKRSITVEPVFGVVKETMGFRQFSMRGLTKARGEWSLVCLAYNLRKLHRHHR